MSGEIPNERPAWCPHTECQFLCASQQQLCVGKLPAPEEHGGVANTHRLCFHGAEDDPGPDGNVWTFPLMLNRGDAWNITRLLKLVTP